MSRGNLIWGVILVFFGLLFLLDNLYIMDFGQFISTFWPVILIAIGIKIILDRRKKSSDSVFSEQQSDQLSQDRINENNVFGDIVMNVNSSDFRGGILSNVFGDIKVDLSDVVIQKEECKISVTGVFGDITVITPKGILLRAKSSAVAGDLVIKGNRKEGIMPNLDYIDPGFEASSPRLFIQGSIVFGSVNIF